jgi:HD-GYP domain-containing protein (c-di-GMP phosphodiesterase class II)
MDKHQSSSNGLRLAELMASLSLAIDLGTGQPMEWVMRCCLLGVQLAETLGMSVEERRDVYYLTLLRHLGCTSSSADDADLFGDELGLAELMLADITNIPQIMSLFFRLVGKNQPPLQRIQTLARALYVSPRTVDDVHAGHCEVAVHLSDTLGFDSHIQTALWQLYERWDGRGAPRHLKGDDLFLPVRVIHLAQDATSFYRVGGIDAAVEVARQRSGGVYDPAIVDLFCHEAPDLLSCLNVESTWDAVLAAEPGAPTLLSEDQVESALQAVADFTDLKTPQTRGHSRSVADLVETAARQCGLLEAEVVALRRAALLHDLGRVGVSAAIWCKTGTLTESEWERVRLHPYYTERIFARASHLANIASLAAMHHEHLDGSGYHRGLRAPMLSPSARLLVAANAYCARLEPRPHRAMQLPDAAADDLRREVRNGKLDTHAVDAVLSAAGHPVHRSRRSPSVQLSEREIEVLRLIARGLSNKQIGVQLTITEKTVEHHVTHIYNKIGVSTRAGATLFAMQNHLLNDLLT